MKEFAESPKTVKFAENLKKLRKEKKLTQKQLASMTSIPVKSIQNYEQHREGRTPTFHNVMVLADFFDVSPYHMYYGGKEEMSTNSVYMDEILKELVQMPADAIKQIHDSESTGVSLPKLSLSDELIGKLAQTLNRAVNYPERGFYRNYIEQTITRYAQNRQHWKEEFRLK